MIAFIRAARAGLPSGGAGVVAERSVPWKGRTLGAVEMLRGRPAGVASPAPTVTPAAVLDARFPTEAPREQAALLTEHLHVIGVLHARLDEAMGRGLQELHDRLDIRELGHSHWSSLAEGHYGFSAAHARELRKLARRLSELPALRETFLSGLLPRSRVREILDVATPESEAAWTQLARSLGTRALRDRVRDVRAGRREAPTVDDAVRADPMVRVSWLGSHADRVTWEHAKAMLRQVLGVAGPDHVLAEALAAEALSGTSVVPGEGACAARAALPKRATKGSHRRRRAPSQGRLRKLARKLKRMLAKAGSETSPAPLFVAPDFAACETAGDVDDRLVELLRRRNALEWERAQLLALLHGRALYRELGFRTWGRFLEHGLGLSPRDERALRDTRLAVTFLPGLDAAWREGRLPLHRVQRLAEVAEPETETEWLRYAETVTPKLLDAALDAWAVRRQPRELPPWDTRHDELLLDWEAHFGVRLRKRRRGACAEGPSADGPSPDEMLVRTSQLFARRLQRIGFSAPADVAALFREALEVVAAEMGGERSDAEVVRELAKRFLVVHASDEVLRRAAEHRSMTRDRWTCRMPHCRERAQLHEHHVHYRSRGGSDELHNLLTLCIGCHAMVHAGHVAILGTAPDDLTFLMAPGRGPEGGPRAVYRGEVRVRASA